MRSRLVDWWRRRRLTKPRIDCVITAASQAEIPCDLPRHALIVVGDPDQPKRTLFACPCGRGHVITLNLSPKRNPHWELRADGQVSLRPSVDSHEGEWHCHFWLRDGRVQWTPDAR